ncbi:hypothetical protein HK104_000718 [Borealophlyctis nickersoniae]|nr:hypothetical protein HK104_000718 [Borealophlyctis nickersoniae]
MVSTISTESLISTCRRLLTSLQTDEARAAVGACDAWLEQQDGSRRLARLTSRPAPELLYGILRLIHPEDQKATFAACSLMTKAWRRVSWSLSWKEVTVSVKFSARKFVHPRTVKMMGGDVRSLKVEEPVSWSEILLHPSPAMAGLRMIDLVGQRVRVGDVLSLFVHSPNLISLWAAVEWEEDGSRGIDHEEGSVNGEEEDMYMEEVDRGNYWKNHPPGSKETWQAGLTKLKALHIFLVGETVPCGLVMDMADSLGLNLESLEVSTGSRRATNSIIRKVASNCPNLRDFTTPLDADMAPIRHLLYSMPHLLYLDLSHNFSDEMLQLVASTCTTLKYLRVNCHCLTTIRSLAQGPSLRGCQIMDCRGVNMDANELYEFLRHTGPTLESFSLSFWGAGVGVHPNPGDRVLECLREWAPNLRLLEMAASVTGEGVVTEEGVVRFMRASRKLRNFYLPKNLVASDGIHDAAAERNVFVAHPGDLDNPYPYENSLFPSYVELMKERWIGM